jgi:hypothetical protein
MDHEVEDHIYVKAAGSEGAQPVDFEKQGESDHLVERRDCRVEALQVPHLQDATAGFSGIQKALGRSQVGRDRFLNEHVYARFQQGTADFGMGRCRHSDNSSIGTAPEPQKIAERLAVILCGSLLGPRSFDVHYGRQFGPRGVMNDPHVAASELSGAYYGQANRFQQASDLTQTTTSKDTVARVV